MIGLIFAVIFVYVGWNYLESKKKQLYWKKKGIHFIKPYPIIGSSLKVLLLMRSQYGFVRQVYQNNKDKKYVGIYECNRPVFIPIDRELIGNILVKNFSNFVDHGVMDHEPQTEVDETLFTLKGSKWRALRFKMLPAFTTGKLKLMFPEILKCGDSWIKRLESIENQDIELVEITKEFSISVIASCAFGIELPMEPNSEFMKMATANMTYDTKRLVQIFIIYFFPKLASLFDFTYTPRYAAEYFAGLIKETFSYRSKNKIERNDFVQILLDLKEKGSLEINSLKNPDDTFLQMEAPSIHETFEVTERMLISQAYSFIQGGFDAFLNNTVLILYELSINPDIQHKARKELQDVIKKHNNLTYESLKETTYFNNCIKEGFRKYVPMPIIYRECTERYWLEDGTAIEPGTLVYISSLGIHKDPTYYPDPESFNPDRFLEKPIPFTYLPFGEGPRMCIAMRFAELVMKLACASVLLNFNVELSPRTKLPLKMDRNSFFPKTTNPIIFQFKKIK